MAEHKVQGGNMLLFIDPLGGTAYDTVVCLTSVSSSHSRNIIDASSSCGTEYITSTLDISYDFEGQHLQDPDSGKISGTDLRTLIISDSVIGFKISPETPIEGDEIQEGTGHISDISSTYSFDSVGTFSASIKPQGVPSITIFTIPGIFDNTFDNTFN